MSSNQDKTPRKFKITKLKEHPRQAEMFGDVDEQEFAVLVENMHANGLQHPIEILPDGTIVGGHQRVRAAKQLGWKDIDAIIRDDLAAQGEAAVERYFVEDNYVRRQLSPLAKAKCISRLLELAAGESRRTLVCSQKEKFKSEIATHMNISVRSVNRYLLLLTTPIEIQTVFDQGNLPLVTACKVAGLSKMDQQKVIQRIQAGEKPASAVREVIRSQTIGLKNDVSLAYMRILSVLRRELCNINGQVDQIDPRSVQHNANIIHDAIQLLTTLLAVAKKCKK